MTLDEIVQDIKDEWNVLSKEFKLLTLGIIASTGLAATDIAYTKLQQFSIKEAIPQISISLPIPIGNAIQKTLAYADRILHVAHDDPDRAALLASIIPPESGGNPNAISYIKKKDGTLIPNAQGLMQIIPGSGNGIEVKDYQLFQEGCTLLNGKCYVNVGTNPTPSLDNRKKPFVNISGGNVILSQKQRSIEHCIPEANQDLKLRLAITAYNTGEGPVCEAAKNAKKKGNLTWNGVYNEFTSTLIKKWLGKYLGSQSAINKQTDDTRKYFRDVSTNYDYFRGQMRAILNTKRNSSN